MLRDSGEFGISFRYLDAFNYYVFEMGRNENGGFKRIRKFKNGEPEVLATLDDGGFLQNKWYILVIEV